MKKCTKCSVELIEGVNIYPSCIKVKDYKCKSCEYQLTKEQMKEYPQKMLKSLKHILFYVTIKILKLM